MRAREPDRDGYIDRDGVKIGYEVFGTGTPTVLLLPTWTLVHSRIWKAQVPYLARHFRVVTFDGPGNGRSDRPLDPAAYAQENVVAAALEVLDATDTDRAVVASLSRGANWALDLGANHPDRVLGTVFLGPMLLNLPPYDAPLYRFAFTGNPETLPPSRVPAGGTDPEQHWAKLNPAYWQQHYEDFAWFFLGQMYAEPHSTKQIEDGVAWASDTTPEVLATEVSMPYPDEATLRHWCDRVRAPVLVIHGDRDVHTPHERGRLLAELTGGSLLTVAGGTHGVLNRDPVRVNLAIREFIDRIVDQAAPPAPRRITWGRAAARPRRVLYICSPIGLGHVRRDLAIAQQLRTHHPDVQIDWLAQDPVTRVLAEAGETVHPASAALASESGHIESESGEHDLHAFQAIRRMDEILLANFMVFADLVASTEYDLVIGDEAWEVDYFLHENPELKRFGYVWMTDFVGWLPMPDGGAYEARITADYNAEMIDQIARYPRVRDRAIFVGNPADIVPDRFGAELPRIRDWTERHYEFPGYVTGFDPTAYADRQALRHELGYRDDEQTCIVTVGGSGVGTDLLRRMIDAYPMARRAVPGLRMVLVTGPRIDPDALPQRDGLDVRAYVPDLARHLAACDLAVVQGGLTSCMELTATQRPFCYLPLRHHFEQNFHVQHRLARYGAGHRLDYATADPDQLAAVIGDRIGRDVSYRPVETDGAARAAALVADLL